MMLKIFSICMINWFCFKAGSAYFVTCPESEKLCYDTCYNPDEKQCLQSDIWTSKHPGMGYLCNLNEELCGNKCYTPESQHCYNNWYVCENQERICDGLCYSSETHVCSKRIVCKIGEEGCAGECISQETHQCFFDWVTCDKGTLSCGWRCYDPISQACVKGFIINRSTNA